MANNIWEFNEAQNQFSEVVNRAIAEGPQTIRRDGEEVAVILSIAEYNRMIHRQTSLFEFFRQSPLVGVDLDLERRP